MPKRTSLHLGQYLLDGRRLLGHPAPVRQEEPAVIELLQVCYVSYAGEELQDLALLSAFDRRVDHLQHHRPEPLERVRVHHSDIVVQAAHLERIECLSSSRLG